MNKGCQEPYLAGRTELETYGATIQNEAAKDGKGEEDTH